MQKQTLDKDSHISLNVDAPRIIMPQKIKVEYPNNFNEYIITRFAIYLRGYASNRNEDMWGQILLDAEFAFPETFAQLNMTIEQCRTRILSIFNEYYNVRLLLFGFSCCFIYDCI